MEHSLHCDCVIAILCLYIYRTEDVHYHVSSMDQVVVHLSNFD